MFFYGWQGESTHTFFLLLLAWLAVFVPLNVVALRQEWLVLPLLEAFLDDQPGDHPDDRFRCSHRHVVAREPAARVIHLRHR